MRKTVIALVALGLVVASSAFAANAVRISQIYGGGGGGTTNTYKYDYVELFNSSSSAVNIGGWALQYGSATGTTFGSSSYNYTVIPSGATIPACGYYLIQCGSAGSGSDLPVTPDYVSATINVSATTGKFVLTSVQTFNQTCAYWIGPPNGAGYVDLVGFNTASCYETAVAPAINGITALVRKLGGMTDNDNNSTDFLATAQPVTMHNASSGTNPECTIVPATSETWGRIKTIYR